MADTYRIRNGDTLGALSTHFNVPIDRLAEVNGIKNVNKIRTGEVLTIPDLTPPAPAPTATPVPAQDLPGEPTPISQGQVSMAAYSPEGVPHKEGPSTEGSWFDKTVGFLKDVWKDEYEANKNMAQALIDTVKFPGQVLSGEKQMYVLNQETGEQELNPEAIQQATNLALMIVSGGGAGIKQGAGVGTKPPVVDPQVVRDFVTRTGDTATRQARSRQMGRMFPGSQEVVDPQMMDMILGRGTPQGEFTLSSSITKQGKKPHSTNTLMYDDNTGAFYQAYEMGKDDYLMVNYNTRKSSGGGLDIGIAFGRTDTNPAQPSATLKSGTDVLSTVVASARDFIKAAKPQEVAFSAESEALNPLYRRFAQQIAKEFGGTVRIESGEAAATAGIRNAVGEKYGDTFFVDFDDFTPWFKPK